MSSIFVNDIGDRNRSVWRPPHPSSTFPNRKERTRKERQAKDPVFLPSLAKELVEVSKMERDGQKEVRKGFMVCGEVGRKLCGWGEGLGKGKIGPSEKREVEKGAGEGGNRGMNRVHNGGNSEHDTRGGSPAYESNQRRSRQR